MQDAKSQRFYQRSGPEAAPCDSSGIFHRGRFYHLEIERLRSRLFVADAFRPCVPELHSLPHYHIALFTDGDGSWLDENGLHRARERDVLLLPPLVPHMILACRPETYRVIILTFRYRHGDSFFLAPFRNLLEHHVDAAVPDVPQTMRLTVPQAQRLEELLEGLLDASLDLSPYRNMKTGNAFHHVIMQLHGTLAEATDSERFGSVAARVETLRRHLDQFPESALSLDEMARQASMSKEHLIRTFKKHVGMPPARYRRKRRIDKAVSLLLNSDLRIQEIAEATGFDNVFYFSRTFKQPMSVPPSVYREQANRD